MRLNSKLRVQEAHEDSVWTATWTPANTVITGSVDETVKVWGEDSSESLHTFTGAQYAAKRSIEFVCIISALMY